MRRLVVASRGWLLLCASLMSAPAWASDAQPCDEATIDAVAEEVGQYGWQVPIEGAEQNRLVDAACKPWPDDSNQTVLALVYLLNDQPSSGDGRNLRLLVARWDRSNQHLLTQYQEDIEEDAMTEISEGSLWLDTARYWLTPDTRAFGVVVHSTARGASCPDGGANDLLTLFVPHGQRLLPVLHTYLSLWTTTSGSMCNQDDRFKGEKTTLTLAVDKAASNGFANLLVSARVSDLGDEDGKVLRTVRKTLHYDGKYYPLEEWPTFWERGQAAH